MFCYHRVSVVQCVFLFSVLYLLYACFVLFFLLYMPRKDAVILGYFGALLFRFVLAGRIGVGLGRIA